MKYATFLKGAQVFAASLLVALTSPAKAQSDRHFDFTITTATERNPLLMERDGIRADHAISFGHENSLGNFEYRGEITLADDPLDDQVFRLDGSYLAYNLGGFQFGAGLVDRNWSLSRETSLILSRNARPFPSIWISRPGAREIDLPLLRLLGPWTFEVFLGQLESGRVVPNAKMFGMRSMIEPLPGLELGVLRTAQWGGEGRPENWQAFWRMLTGRSNTGPDISASEDPANQLGGFEVGYTLPDRIAPLRVYGQVIGEDEKNLAPAKLMFLWGAEWRPKVMGVPSRFTLEYIDTRAHRTGEPAAGVAYNNFIYRSGYTFRGRVMGASVDTDGVVTRLLGYHEFRDFDLDWGVGHFIVNDADRSDHRLSSTRQEGVLAHVGLGFGWKGFDVGTEIVYQGFDLDTVGIDEGLSAGLSLSRRF